MQVLGFGGKQAREQPLTDGPEGIAMPERHLIVREGFLGGFGPPPIAGLNYDCATVLVPIESGMSGGPVVIYRPTPDGRMKSVVVAISNLDREVHPEPASHPEIEGEMYATAVYALYTHEVPLPDGTWITFRDAIKRGIIETCGPQPD